MDISTSNIWTGTIHQFCMEYIIRPYSMYHEKLSKGYSIIDEYVKDEYLKAIADKLGIKENSVKKLYKNQAVMELYRKKMIQNKEIDFDMILQYSKELVEQNCFIAQNISNIIRSIHVDEFQDTNEKQYAILATLVKANSNINMLFVGDINQAIYRNLGGVAKSASELRGLYPIKFTEECLDGCYRSTQRMVDYYVNYEVAKTGVSSVSKCRDYNGTIKFNSSVDKNRLSNVIANILRKEIERGILEKEICVVGPQWYQIYDVANKLRELMPDNNFDAPDVSPIKYDPLNVFFLISKLLFTQRSEYRLLRRKEAAEILAMIKTDYGFNIPDTITKLDILKSINSTPFVTDDGIKTLENAIKNVLNFLKIKPDGKIEKSRNHFFEKINRRIKEHQLSYDCEAIERSFREKTGIVINTIHGIKGEEYTTVIAFDLLNGHLPNWGYMNNVNVNINLTNNDDLTFTNFGNLILSFLLFYNCYFVFCSIGSSRNINHIGMM